MHIDSIFLRTDKSMIGLRISSGLFFFLGYGNGVRMPICFSDSGFFMLYISTMLLCIEDRDYLITPACISSMPVLLPFLMYLTYL